MQEVLLNQPGKKVILLGNDAIVRGALESGVQFVSTYPGTPASEIGNTFYAIKEKAKIHFEFSSNEKTALEAAVGSSFSGLKTLVAMKNFGLNVCLDPLLPFVYTGTKGPTVIVIADDPSCHSSAQSEENSRALAYLAHIPILEPSDPQECKDFIIEGFKLSEKFNIPVMIRTTTRVAHQKMPVKLGKLPAMRLAHGKFVKDVRRFVTLPPRVLMMKLELLEKIKKMKNLFENSRLNRVDSIGTNKVGVVASGVSYLYVLEALKELKINLPILKIGSFYPLPEKKVAGFLKSINKVLVVEELEPYLENEVLRLAKDVNPKIKVYGKDLVPEIGEMEPEYVISALSNILRIKHLFPKWIKIKTVKRFPQFCPGCPYWLVMSGIKKAVNEKEVIFGGDIGCYMLTGMPPHNLQDYLSCMGSSIGIAHGIKKVSDQKLIAFIGDSTFFHAGIPALINCVVNKSNPLIIIMDNQITAMTGHQPSIGDVLKLEDMVKSCGVKNFKVVDPSNQVEFINTIKDFIQKKEVSVLIARKPCLFVNKK